MVVRVELAGSHYVFGDTGCSFASSCLSCPFATCLHDGPEEFKRARVNQRAQEIMALRADGMTVKATAAHLDISERSVDRIVAVARENGGMIG